MRSLLNELPQPGGRLWSAVPRRQVDQYAATLAQWFGVSLADANVIFPLLNRFPATDLGFLLPAF